MFEAVAVPLSAEDNNAANEAGISLDELGVELKEDANETNTEEKDDEAIGKSTMHCLKCKL